MARSAKNGSTGYKAFNKALKAIQTIGTEMGRVFHERADEINSLLCAIVAGEHVLMLGPPGTAKSAQVNSLCEAISGATFFEWLLTKFSTPEELFGPVSFKGMEKDEYRRITKDKLPEAHIAFLDEIFKANSAILNALLALINERKFHNNGAPVACPLITVVGASNELPEEDSEGLDALYDRFMLRHWVEYIQDRDAMKAMLLGAEPEIKAGIALNELKLLQSACVKVTMSDEILDCILTIKAELESIGIRASDRRWKRAIKLVKAQALLSGRSEVEEDDLLILQHCLWRTPDQRAMMRNKVGGVASPLTAEALEILDAANEIHRELLTKEGSSDFISESVEARAALMEMRERLQRRISESNGQSKRAQKVLERIKGLSGDVKRRSDRAFGD